MTQIQVSNAKVYNKLMEVVAANRAFQERGGEDAVGRYLSIIAEGGLQDHLGIRLLHKHNDLADDEIMLETDVIDGEGFALVTAATPTSRPMPQVCNSWQATPHGYAPIEFSRAELVDPSFCNHKSRRVLATLADALNADGMADLLGPCVMYSRYVAQYAPLSDAAFLEKTDTTNRANVVRYVVRDDISFQNSAKTKWHAKMTTDAAGRTVWMTACNCFCSVLPEGGHQGTTTHSPKK
jgi:hypothetical protein